MSARDTLLGRRPLGASRQSGAARVPRGAVTFPTTALNARIYIALGADLSAHWSTWTWADITEFVRYDPGVSVTAGRRDEASRVEPGAGVLVLDNRDGRFCRRNPTSPYYGLLSMNTPIWGTVDAGSGAKTRLQQFVNEWPARWDKSGNDCVVPIRTSGVLRRLAQGEVFKSALRRAMLAAGPTVYWPLEDEGSTGYLSSALSGGQPIFLQDPVLSTDDIPAGSSGALSLIDSLGARQEGSIYVSLPSTTEFQVEIVGVSDQGANTLMLNIYPYLPDQTAIGTGILTAQADGEPHHRVVQFVQNGANVDHTYYVDGVVSSTGSTSSVAIASSIRLEFYRGQYSTGVANISHVAVLPTRSAPASRASAINAYDGEYAHERIRRICLEEGLIYTASSASPVQMGPQPEATFLDVLRECEAADMGVLYEVDWGLGFQSTMDRYNATVGLTVDFDSGQVAEPPEPTDDDQRVTNRFTASRSGGSEYTDEVTTGPMGTGAQGPGLYDDSATVNVYADNQLSSFAGWRTHLGTVDEDRWPRVDLNFTAAPELIDTWTALAYGPRVNVTNPPDQAVPATVDAFIEGHAERWDTKSWSAALNTSPASPFRVGVVASTSGNLGRVDAANSTLAADVSDVATTLSVASTGALWRTGSVSFDIGVGGEQMTVSNISGGSSPQTFTVTRSVNGVVKAQPASVGGIPTKVSLWKPAAVAY